MLHFIELTKFSTIFLRNAASSSQTIRHTIHIVVEYTSNSHWVRYLGMTAAMIPVPVPITRLTPDLTPGACPHGYRVPVPMTIETSLHQ